MAGDLSGHLLETMRSGGRHWRVISLPALAGANDALGRNPGEPLWPEWQPLEELEALRHGMLPREWSALFQQNPVPEDGDYFKSDWIRPIDVMPDLKTLKVFGGSDYAVTADNGDYTVHVVVGIDAEQRLYLLDLWRGQTSSDVWVEAWCDLVCKWKPISWGEETGQINSGVGPFLKRRAIERQAWTARLPFPSRSDKAIRAQSIRGRMAMQGLYVPASAPWRADSVSELLSFPAGKHDDQVDAISLVGQLLEHARGYVVKEPEPKRRDDQLEYSVTPDGRVRMTGDLLKVLEARRKRRENA